MTDATKIIDSILENEPADAVGHFQAMVQERARHLVLSQLAPLVEKKDEKDDEDCDCDDDKKDKDGDDDKDDKKKKKSDDKDDDDDKDDKKKKFGKDKD